MYMCVCVLVCVRERVSAIEIQTIEPNSMKFGTVEAQDDPRMFFMYV